MVPKWLRELSAKQLFTGSSPVHALNITMPAHRKELKIEGPNLWYLVGLITTDGCLANDGRHIDITSADKQFLARIILSMGLINKIGIKNKGNINQAYHIQIANKNFYEFLLSIGLLPNKSLKLKRLSIPKEFFNDFLRGVIDGDGCLRSWIHPSNNHEQWSLRIFSGSKVFIKWLESRIEESTGCRGRVHSDFSPHRMHRLYTLKYGKLAAAGILKNCYYKGAFGLERKSKVAHNCCIAPMGWSKSKTIIN